MRKSTEAAVLADRTIRRPTRQVETRFCDYTEFAELLGVHKATVFRWVRAGVLPAPIYLTRTKPAFVRAEVEAFIAERIAARPTKKNDAA